jgi:hypothetical protein
VVSAPSRSRVSGKRVVGLGALLIALGVVAACVLAGILWRASTTPPAWRAIPDGAVITREERIEDDLLGDFEHRIELDVDEAGARAWCAALGLPARAHDGGSITCGEPDHGAEHGAFVEWRARRARYHGWSR